MEAWRDADNAERLCRASRSRFRPLRKAYLIKSRGSGIRTHTGGILSPVPLPLGYAPKSAAWPIIRVFWFPSIFHRGSLVSFRRGFSIRWGCRTVGAIGKLSSRFRFSAQWLYYCSALTP